MIHVRFGAAPPALTNHARARPVPAARPARLLRTGAGAAVLLGLLAGCGGGGGSGGDAGAPVVAATALGITGSNREDVARTMVAALTGLSLTEAVNTLLPSAAPRSRALALGAVWMPSQVLATVQAALSPPQARALSANAEGRARALVVLGPFTDNCAAGGTVASTLNDADNSGTLSSGDSMALVYTNCRVDAELSLNGQYEVRYGSVVQGSTPTVVATITMTRFVTTETITTDTQRVSILNGRARMEYVQRSGVRQDTTLTTETDLVTEVRLGSRNDTVTLQAGYTTLSVVETDLAPPEGGLAGRASVTTQGTVLSSTLGGSVVLSTPAPLVAYFVDDYPRTGTVLATGRSSSLRLTAVSASQARLDLDSNGDGTVDSSSTVAWRSLE